MVVPTALAIAIDAVLMRWIHIPVVEHGLLGLSAAAAGLVWAMGFKMGARFRGAPVPLVLAGLAFVAAGPLAAPLPVVVLLLGPPGVVWVWRRS
jgi:chromate transporter